MSEGELIEGLKKNYREAGQYFVEQFHGKVYGVCYSFVKNSHDAEDITQDVFVDAIRNIGNFRQDSRLSTWLHRIAVNRSINFLRKSRRTVGWVDLETLLFPAENEQGLTTESTGETRLINQEKKAIIHEAINNLPANQQKAFVLNKYDEYSYKEIAELMELSLSAVESLIHRAKMNLRKQLTKHFSK